MALPLLQRKMAPTWAALIIGVIWGTWHTPAFLLSGTEQSAWSFLPFFMGTIALSVIVTPLFNASRGSIFLPALFYFMLINPVWPDAQPYDTYLFALIAVVLVWLISCSVTHRPSLTPSLEHAFANALERFRLEHEFPGITASYLLPSGKNYSAAAGWADLERREAMTVESRMLAASIGKTFVTCSITPRDYRITSTCPPLSKPFRQSGPRPAFITASASPLNSRARYHQSMVMAAGFPATVQASATTPGVESPLRFR